MAGVSGFLGVLGIPGSPALCFRGFTGDETGDNIDTTTSCDVGTDSVNGGTCLFENGIIGKRRVKLTGETIFDPTINGDPIVCGVGTIGVATINAGYAWLATIEFLRWSAKAQADGALTYEFEAVSRGSYARN